MRKKAVFVLILLHNAIAEDSNESCPKITSTEVKIQDCKGFQLQRLRHN